MPLNLMYITNDPAVALIAEKNGVDRIWVDLEKLGKEERQKGVDSVKSDHSIKDVTVLSNVLTKSELMVRVNPWNEASDREIEQVIDYGANRIMLPMWKTKKETDCFLNLVRGRVKTTLLLETKEAVECLDEVLHNQYIDEIHIGLNDLHLSFGLTFMFELLTNGVVEKLCKKLQGKGILYGFGGIAKLGAGMIPAEKIIMEHYRLGSTRAILSRSFCNSDEIKDINEIENIFSKNIKELRRFEEDVSHFTSDKFLFNKQTLENDIAQIVEMQKRKNADE
ncbi:MAG: aldolase [Clostridia bacterium]|nr:aldolase [Clostridia bacterium]